MARSLLLLALLLAACGGGSADESAEAPSMADGAVEMDQQAQTAADRLPVTPTAQNTAPDSAAARHLIRRATLRLRVGDYARALTEVAATSRRFGAYVGGEQELRSPGLVENTLTLRVEAARFEALMEALLALGEEVDFRNVEVEDVTRQYVDLEARLGARRAVAERLTALLARANTVEDVLAVQVQLAAVQEQIEAAEAELRYLRNQVALSTITLTIFEESATGLVAGPTFPTRLGRALNVGWDGLIELLVAVVALWPVWLIGALLWPLWRRLERRRKARAQDRKRVGA